MKDRHVALSGSRLSEWAHIFSQLVVHRHRKEFGLMTSLTEQIADAPGAVTNRVAPMSRRYPLIDDQLVRQIARTRRIVRCLRSPLCSRVVWCQGQRLIGRRPELTQFVHLLAPFASGPRNQTSREAAPGVVPARSLHRPTGECRQNPSPSCRASAPS